MNKLFLGTVEFKHAYTPAIQEKLFSSFFFSRCFQHEYLTAKQKYLFYVYLCTFYSVGYNFVVIFFILFFWRKMGLGLILSRWNCFAFHIKGQENDVSRRLFPLTVLNSTVAIMEV